MLRAGALYFAIVIAFFIAIISASLIMLAAHYRNSYLKNIRHQRLTDIMDSGLAYAIIQKIGAEENEIIDLYGQGTDSLHVQRSVWGIYELVQLQTNIQQDTMRRTFLMGKQADSIALYLSDEDRPLSISGNTRLTGNIALPKSGLRQAYAEGKPYTGDKLVFHGQITNSGRTLPTLDDDILSNLTTYLESFDSREIIRLKNTKAPFHKVKKELYVGNEGRLDNITLDGKIIVIADSILTISATAKLSDIQVYAPIIKVEKGFNGNCQLFARDSLIVSEKVTFKYPSSLGVIRTESSVAQPQLVLGNEVSLEGMVFSYEKERSAMQTMISLGKAVHIKGEVFCTGLLKLDKEVHIDGKVACNRFIMRTPQTLYENFLIDVAFNREARSTYYLSAILFGRNRENKVLKWLD